jgi:hypothetical protein
LKKGKNSIPAEKLEEIKSFLTKTIVENFETIGSLIPEQTLAL